MSKSRLISTPHTSFLLGKQENHLTTSFLKWHTMKQCCYLAHCRKYSDFLANSSSQKCTIGIPAYLVFLQKRQSQTRWKLLPSRAPYFLPLSHHEEAESLIDPVLKLPLFTTNSLPLPPWLKTSSWLSLWPPDKPTRVPACVPTYLHFVLLAGLGNIDG